MRWLQRDPILLDGGESFYEYVMGNPVRFVDPTGKAAAAISVLDALAAAIAQAAGEVSAGAVAGAASAGTVVGVGAPWSLVGAPGVWWVPTQACFKKVE